MGHEPFQQLGKEAGPRKEQTSFQSIIGKRNNKKNVFKGYLEMYVANASEQKYAILISK